MMRQISMSLLALVLVTASLTPVSAQRGPGRVRLGARLGDRASGVRIRVNYAGNADGGKLFRVTIRGRGLEAGAATLVGCGSSWDIRLASPGNGDRARVGGRLLLNARRGDDVPTCVDGGGLSVTGPGGLDVSGNLQGRGGRGPRG